MNGHLYVETTGHGPPWVLLHGWAMHGGLFAPLVPALARRYRVSSVDLPGHGFSAPTDPYTLDRIVATVSAHFENEAEPLTVLGWSLGGMVALRWARREPQRVAHLILVCTTPRFVASANWPHAMAATTLARFGDELRIAYRPTLQRFLSLQLQGSADGRFVLAQMRQALFARGEPSAQALSGTLALLSSTDLREEAAAIRTPALIVTGERDALTPSAAGHWLAQAMPAARHVEIGGAAHAPFLSHRAAFDAALSSVTDAR